MIPSVAVIRRETMREALALGADALALIASRDPPLLALEAHRRVAEARRLAQSLDTTTTINLED
jgi:hypothetical protein